MALWFQYQAKTEPTFVPPEVVTQDKWFRPLSEPVRVKPGSLIALAASGLFWSTFTPPSPGTGNAPPISATTPVVFDASFQYQDYTAPVLAETPTPPIPGTETAVPVGAPNQVVYQYGFQYQSTAFPTPFTAETVTADKWFAQLSTPVRVKVSLDVSKQQAIAFVAFDAAPLGWRQSWSEPVRQRPRVAETQAVLPPNPTVSFSWFAPLDKPTLRKGAVAQQQDLAWSGFTPAATSTTTEWLSQWSDPVRLKPGLAAQQQQFYAGPINPTVSFSWFEPLADPRVPLKPKVAEHPATTIGVPPADIGWYRPISEPTLQKKTAHLQQSLAWSTFTPLPVHAWIGPYSEPVRTRALAAAQQQALIWSNFTPPREVATIEWFTQFAELKLFKRGLPAHQQQFLAQNPNNFFPETVTEDRWHQPWSEPVRSKSRATDLNQSVMPPQQTAISWFGPLSEPVRLKPRLRDGAQLFAAQPINPTVSFSWFGAIDQPTLRKPAVAQQQALAWGFFTPTTTSVTVEWLVPWSEPARTKLRAADLTQIVRPLPPFVSFGWFEPLTEPVRFRRPVPWQQFLALDTSAIPLGRLEPWFAPWSTPAKLGRQFPVSEQQALAFVKAAPFGEIILLNWYAPWRDPVRTLAGLKAHLQQTTVLPSRVILNPVTVTMAATETNGDVGEFAVLVGATPSRVIVSIVEVGPDRGVVHSLIEGT